MSDAQIVKRLSAKVEQLEAELAAERERANYKLACLRDEMKRADANVAKLREALHNFSTALNYYDSMEPPLSGYIDDWNTLTVSDLRRARAVLDETGKKE